MIGLQQCSRPELEVLLACARTRMTSETSRRAKDSLKNSIDWDYLIALAQCHGTAPLLFRNISGSQCGAIPDDAFKQLRNVVENIARWNLYLTGELLSLLEGLADIGIRVLPLKGPILGVWAYGDVALRPFGDLDILMPIEDIPEARDLLISRNYQPVLQFSAAEEQGYLNTHHDYKFCHLRDQRTVELQWGVTQWSFAFPINFDEIWQRRGELHFSGRILPTIAVEDLLVLLCVHGAKHRWEQLKWICDISEITSAHGNKIDWDTLINRAVELGARRMLFLGLCLAHRFFDANVPCRVLSVIQREPKIERLAEQISNAVCRDLALDDNVLGDEKPFFYWHVRERFADKLAIARRYCPDYCRRLLVPKERDREFIKLPETLSSGYYLVRPIRLLRDYWYKVGLNCNGAKK